MVSFGVYPNEGLNTMKLGEALNERSRLAKRVTELRNALDDSLIVTEGEEPAMDVDKVTAEILGTINTIEGLVSSINATNAATKLEDGRTITQALAARDALGAKVSHYEHIFHKLTNVDPYSYRRAASELKSVRTASVEEMLNEKDRYARERRVLDAELQALNWATELIDN